MSSMFKQEGLETATSLGVACIILYYLNRQLSKRQLVNLPPGPPADPIIGHARMIPAKGQDVFFYELGKLYGDVVQLRVLDRSMIILNSVEAAEDLLDARSYNYSDRPDLPVYDLLGIGDALGFAKYGKDFRVQRRMVQQYFSNSKRPEHRPVQTREARILALNILSVTQDWYKHLIRFSTAVVVEISYGHQIISNDDPYFEIAEECGKIAADSGPPGATPVDLFPILRHFPSWFPGTYYANFARKSFPAFQRLREYPFSQVTEKMNNGVALPSFLLTQLEALRSKGDFDAASIRLLQLASMHLYIAGTDTTSSLLAFFVLAMVLHPEHQAKAQEEIETIIGHDRLPDFHDRKSLPYLECILQETLRWNHAAPTGGPHRSMEDDIYKGMFIPKGSIVIANIRGMSWNEKVYRDPFKFDPARFLPAPSGRGEPFFTAHFGFGRRICPGRYLAEDSLWVAIATLLATGEFLKPLDIDGKEIYPDATPITTGILCHPHPFQCRFKPRTSVSADLLKQSTE